MPAPYNLYRSHFGSSISSSYPPCFIYIYMTKKILLSVTENASSNNRDLSTIQSNHIHRRQLINYSDVSSNSIFIFPCIYLDPIKIIEGRTICKCCQDTSIMLCNIFGTTMYITLPYSATRMLETNINTKMSYMFMIACNNPTSLDSFVETTIINDILARRRRYSKEDIVCIYNILLSCLNIIRKINIYIKSENISEGISVYFLIGAISFSAYRTVTTRALYQLVEQYQNIFFKLYTSHHWVENTDIIMPFEVVP